MQVGDVLGVVSPEDPERTVKNIGHRIAQIRREKKLTQRQLAAKLGVSIPWLSKLETTGSNMTIKTMIKIAGALGVRGRDLWDVPRPEPRSTKGRPIKSVQDD